jgi:D-beta-D-heptose 7-phosphate kinase/D-beta-D-heptose 1-phosphate adenosyltransferase
MLTRLIELVEGLPPSRIVLVGDFMLDRYIFGKTERISPEAPVPVVRYQHEEYRLGGAGFVAACLGTLGAKVRCIGLVGQDEPGRELRRRLGEFGDPGGLIETAGRPTVLKMRVLGSSQDRTPQQMVRLDFEDSSHVDETTASTILAGATAALREADLLCLEDYNKGVLTPDVTRQLIAAARQMGTPVIIDPGSIGDYSKYAGATALKLNRPEAEKATGLTVRSVEQCGPAARRMIEQLGLEAVIITLNELGAYLACRDGEERLLSTRPRQVADATGAGDMVLATVCLARCAGASWVEAVALANVAGGLEVERLGCVPVTPREVVQDLLRDHHEQSGKQRSLGELLPELARHRAAGRKIVFTNGCFDLIHLGHVSYFRFAKAQGDVLVVGVNTDDSISRLKGPKRPIIQEDDRISVLEELESIDYLVRFDDDTPLRLISAIRPDVLVKGADYSKEQVVGWEIVEGCGGRIALAPLVDGRSTSHIVQRILQAYRQE